MTTPPLRNFSENSSDLGTWGSPYTSQPVELNFCKSVSNADAKVRLLWPFEMRLTTSGTLNGSKVLSFKKNIFFELHSDAEPQQNGLNEIE